MEERDHTIEVDICHYLGLEAVSAKMLNTVPLNKTKNDQYVWLTRWTNLDTFSLATNAFFPKTLFDLFCRLVCFPTLPLRRHLMRHWAKASTKDCHISWKMMKLLKTFLQRSSYYDGLTTIWKRKGTCVGWQISVRTSRYRKMTYPGTKRESDPPNWFDPRGILAYQSYTGISGSKGS